MPEVTRADSLPLRRGVTDFIDHLKGERRASPHTSAAYRRDLAQLEAFLEQRLGQPAKLSDVGKLELRAWLSRIGFSDYEELRLGGSFVFKVRRP